MDQLQAMRTFIMVVEANSFSRAAAALQIPRASATTIIKNLEIHLKVRLLHRTTRRLSLTAQGAQYYELCARILSEIRECEDALVETGRGPRGQLHIEMPGSIGRLVVTPRIMEFRSRYPDIDLVIGFAGQPVSAARETLDCFIQSGDFHHSTFIRRPLGEIEMLTAASPAYLERRGEPRSLVSLEAHSAVHYYSNSVGRVVAFNFVVEHVPEEIRMKTSLVLSDIEAYVTCGVTGAGVIQAPRFLLQTYLDDGSLVEILSKWKPLSIPLWALYLPNRQLAAKVRVFVEWLAKIFEEYSGLSLTRSLAGKDFVEHEFNDLASSL
jgi:LysR family transcriptional regulator, regulator for bpeEF and oprC